MKFGSSETFVLSARVSTILGPLPIHFSLTAPLTKPTVLVRRTIVGRILDDSLAAQPEARLRHSALDLLRGLHPQLIHIPGVNSSAVNLHPLRPDLTHVRYL